MIYKIWVERSFFIRIFNNLRIFVVSNKVKYEGKSVLILFFINSYLYSIIKDFRKSILKNGFNNNFFG